MKAKKCRECGETIDVALRAAEEAKREAEAARREASRSRRGGGANQQVVIHRGGRGRRDRRFPHALRLILTVFTLGVWLPIWIIHLIIWDNR